MALMLRHKPTGDLYVYTELLARRGDMESLEVLEEKVAVEKPVVEVAKKTVRKGKSTPLMADLDIDV